MIEQPWYTSCHMTRGVADSVNFECFVWSSFEHLHCITIGKSIKARLNWHKIEQVEHTPVTDHEGYAVPQSIFFISM